MSTVALLAIDKRVTFLAKGNDLDKDTIAEPYGKYDSKLQMSNFELEKSNWIPCTPEQLKIYEIIKQNKLNSSTHTVFNELIDNLQTGFTAPRKSFNNDTSQSEIKVEKLIRKNFPETWLFENIEVGTNSKQTLQRTLPDSITTWIVSAFAMHKKLGFALADPQELVVKQDFFMKLNIPSFAKVTEIIKVQVLVFNYNPNINQLTATVTLSKKNPKNFKIVEKTKAGGGECITTEKVDSLKAINVTVGYRTPSVISFYVKATEVGDLTLILEANVRNSDVYDIVHKNIIIENHGLRKFTFTPSSYILPAQQTVLNVDNSNCKQISVTAVGDVVSNTMGFTAPSYS